MQVRSILDKNRTWFFTLAISMLSGLGIVWGAFSMAFVPSFADDLGPLEPLDPANYSVDEVVFLQPLSPDIIPVALIENQLIEKWRDELWASRSSAVPDLPPPSRTPTADPALKPSSTPLPTNTQVSGSPTATASRTKIPPTVIPDSATPAPTESPTISLTPVPTLAPTSTSAPTSPPRPTQPKNPTIVPNPPAITPTPITNVTNTPKFGT